MIPLFKNAGLIGLGLIGGSIARAMKKQGLAETITGYTKSSESLQTALQLGIIDNIASSSSQLAESCDIIIICTPLSTYENILKEIAPVIKNRTCIITDVGSLKAFTMELAEKYLSKENQKSFIPAHPIAGTEKTGVEAGFAELFNGKRTILTPASDASSQAIKKVSELWSGIGSKIEIMDASAHDKIYAEVSHLPQFLAYCYAALLKNTTKKQSNLTEEFLRFSRICASDPTIWLDIFAMNISNLLACLNNFTNELKNNAITAPVNDEYLYKILPAIIAGTLIKCSPNSNYAGSGFKDFTSYPKTALEHLYNFKADNRGSTNEIYNKFLFGINELSSYLKHKQPDKALDFMRSSSAWYKDAVSIDKASA